MFISWLFVFVCIDVIVFVDSCLLFVVLVTTFICVSTTLLLSSSYCDTAITYTHTILLRERRCVQRDRNVCLSVTTYSLEQSKKGGWPQQNRIKQQQERGRNILLVAQKRLTTSSESVAIQPLFAPAPLFCCTWDYDEAAGNG